MSRNPPRPLIVCGLGPIGIRVAELASPTFGPIVLVDIDPPAALPRLPAELSGETIVPRLTDALRAHPRAPVILSTRSEFDACAPDLGAAAAAGSTVITSCEEALWPFVRYPDLSRDLDQRAREGGGRIVGLGINPGYLMDFLPAVASAPFPEPESILVERRVDVATRRAPLQRKVGVGLTAEEFLERKRTAGIGHRGLEESIHLLGAALGVTWDRVETEVEPVLATHPYPPTSNQLGVEIPEGGVIGMRNSGAAELGGRRRVEMDLIMALQLSDPVDRIELRGPDPFPFRLESPGGVPGDDGTAHVLLAAIPLAEQSPPGLKTLLDLPGGLRGHWG